MHTEGSDFFDSLGSQSQLSNEQNSLPRPASELYLSTQGTDAANDVPLSHSTSQNALDELQPLRNPLLAGQLQNTESMQSITLSRESLASEPQNSSNLSLSNENVTHTAQSVQKPVQDPVIQQQNSEVQPNPQLGWDPAQQHQQQQQPPSDHSQAFDNPAMKFEKQYTSSQQQVYPEQPAMIQNTIINTQV